MNREDRNSFPGTAPKDGCLLVRMPDFCDYAVDVPSPGVRGIGDTHVLGHFLRDVSALNSEQRKFRGIGQWNVQEPK